MSTAVDLNQEFPQLIRDFDGEFKTLEQIAFEDDGKTPRGLVWCVHFEQPHVHAYYAQNNTTEQSTHGWITPLVPTYVQIKGDSLVIHNKPCYFRGPAAKEDIRFPIEQLNFNGNKGRVTRFFTSLETAEKYMFFVKMGWIFEVLKVAPAIPEHLIQRQDKKTNPASITMGAFDNPFLHKR